MSSPLPEETLRHCCDKLTWRIPQKRGDLTAIEYDKKAKHAVLILIERETEGVLVPRSIMIKRFVEYCPLCGTDLQKEFAEKVTSNAR